MKSIEINTTNGIAKFTTKALIMGSNEFAYTKISDIKHSSANKLYLFKYDGHWHKLEYLESESDRVNALFAKIAALRANKEATRLAKVSDVSTADVAPAATSVSPATEPVSAGSVSTESVSPVIDQETLPQDSVSPSINPEQVSADEGGMPSSLAELISNVEASIEENLTHSDKPAVDVSELVEVAENNQADSVPIIPITGSEDNSLDNSNDASINAESDGFADGSTDESIYESNSALINTEEAESITSAGAEAFEEAEKIKSIEEASDEKKSRLKKALAIFGIIIAIFAIAAIVYFFVIGPSSSPNIGPNADGTQEYNNIDELIEDLQ